MRYDNIDYLISIFISVLASQPSPILPDNKFSDSSTESALISTGIYSSEVKNNKSDLQIL